MIGDDFQLGLDPSRETGLLLDRRTGLSMAIPGRPVLAPGGGGGPGAPTFQVAVEVGALPVTLRLRTDTLPVATPQPALAAVMAQAYALNRAPGPAQVSAAVPARLELWGAISAASAIYPLRAPDAAGCDAEELLLLVRAAPGGAESWAAHVTKRFRTRDLAPLDWSSFNTALAGSTRWAPGAPAPPVPVLFPPSRLVGDRLPLRLAPAGEALAAALVPVLAPLPAALRAELAAKLLALAGGSDAPTDRLAAHRPVYRRYVESIAPSDAVAGALAAPLDEVETAHDLRGWVMAALQALDPQAARKPPSTASGVPVT